MLTHVPKLLTHFSLGLLFFGCKPAHLPDTQLGNWVQSASIGLYPRSNATYFVIGNHAYVGLGFNENQPQPGRLKDFWTFSIDSGWTQLPDFPGAPRSNAAAFSVGNYGYVGTGYDTYNVFTDFYQYDPAQQVWTKKRDFGGGPRYDAVGFAIKGKGYLGTGLNKYWTNDFWQYDPDQDTWTQTPGTSGNFSKRSGAVAFVYNDKAYVVTGTNNNVPVRDMWSFDPSQSKAWTQLANITNTDPDTFDDGYTDIQRDGATAFVNGEFAYLTTGSNGTMQTSTWAYDIAHDRWSRRTAYPRAPRTGAASFTIKGLSFVGTGYSGNKTTFDDFDQFLPLAAFNPNDY